MSELSLEQIRELIQLVSDHKLDYLQVGDIHIKKSIHQIKEEKVSIVPPLTPEELLYGASGLGKLSSEETLMVMRPKRGKQVEG